MPLPDTITPEWLREQLFEFDKYHGIYREHPFEGWAIWQWLNGERAIQITRPTSGRRQLGSSR